MPLLHLSIWCRVGFHRTRLEKQPEPDGHYRIVEKCDYCPHSVTLRGTEASDAVALIAMQQAILDQARS